MAFYGVTYGYSSMAAWDFMTLWKHGIMALWQDGVMGLYGVI